MKPWPAKSLFLLGLFVSVATIAMLSNPLQIVLTGLNAVDRDELGNSIVRFVLHPAGVLLLLFSLRRLTLNKNDVAMLLILLALPVSSFIARYVSGFGYSRLHDVLNMVVAISPFFLFRHNVFSRSNLKTMLFLLFAASATSTLLCYLYFHSIGQLVYFTSGTIGIDRPQIGGNLLQSTELSNILGGILLLGLACRRLYTNHAVRVIVFLLSIPIAGLFVMTGAIGSFSALIAVVLAFYAMRRVLSRPPVLLAAILVATACAIYYAVAGAGFAGSVYDALNNKIVQDCRNDMYSSLWQMIQAHWFQGCGYGAFREETGGYPHHNILGIWSEMGLICMLCYLLEAGLCLYCGFKLDAAIGRGLKASVEMEVARCFCMMAVFLHLKGLVHDTWYDHSLRVYEAAMAGLFLKIHTGLWPWHRRWSSHEHRGV